MRPLIIDNFAGGGGASTGIERALGRVDVAINHDPEAIAMHEANHPETTHLIQSIMDVDPLVNAKRPFIVPLTHHGSPRGHDPAEPMPTVTAAHRGELATVDAAIVPITHTKGGNRATAASAPLPTITTAKGGEFARVTATLAPHDTKFRSGSVGSDAGDPMPTVTANGDSARPAGATPLGVVGATMVQMGYGERGLVVAHMEKFAENSRGRPADEPSDTIMAGATRHGCVTAFLSHFYTSNTNGGRGDPLLPAKAVTAEGQHHAVVCAHMEQANTGRIGHPTPKPVSTITSPGAHQRLVETVLVDADALPAQMLERAVQVAAFLVKYYGNEVDGHGLDQPLGTVTTKDRFAVVTVTIDAVTYVIVDIGMRMLTRRELANAQGFPAGYVLDPIGPSGKPLSISSSIRMIGNSVCPDMAEALARANVRLARFNEQQEAA